MKVIFVLFYVASGPVFNNMKLFQLGLSFLGNISNPRQFALKTYWLSSTFVMIN